MTAPPTTDRPLKPENLMGRTRLGDSEYRSVVRLLAWLGRVRAADVAHPRVRLWGVPAFYALGGVPALVRGAHDSAPAFVLTLAITAGYTVPLLWRKQRPGLVFAVLVVLSEVSLALGVDSGSSATQLVALLNLGRFGAPGQLAVAVAYNLTQTFVSILFFNSANMSRAAASTPVLAFLAVVAILSMAALGLAGKLVNAYIEALQEHAVRLELERDQRAQLAAATERARVAREMHDILGHTLAVIVGLAGGAAGLAETKPKRGADTLRIIAESGRGALAELRRLLAVIHEDEDEPGETPLAPQPGLADLGALMERVRSAGPAAALRLEGRLACLPQGLQLAVYRIVQEALTNTLKHAAPDTTVEVTVTADAEAVHITVEDTGPRQAAGTDEPGKGLVGMRERAALYGGQVAAGPNSRGGWTVSALLHLTSTAPDLMEKHPA
ncbi:histidine kinase [Streptomyces sp. NBC_01478]|uniref:sensor histidine kinase n=1 Tax=Streptomyces sp. NBC_01478 TaxID=2903882 RepID=UPI002E334D40|nr:histidine kinase [Streptomyces sp. NBC_01478]